MRKRWVVVVALVVAVAAVSTGPAGASVTAKLDGCKVLKASEVTRITGFAATTTPVGTRSKGEAGCSYALDDLAPHSVLLVVQKNGGQNSKIAYRTTKAAFKDQIEPVSGFGKNAFYAGGGLNTLYVLKGGTLFYVQYIVLADTDAAGIKDDVVAMAKIAQPRV